MVDGLVSSPERQQALMEMLEGHKEAANVKKGLQEMERLNQ